MQKETVGISDLSLYVPGPRVDLKTLLEYRVAADPALERRLKRAIESTGQLSIRYPEIWEDGVTLSAEAVAALLKQNPSFKLDGLRYLVSGTETAVDHSKPIASYVEGALQNAGFNVPSHLSTFQIQHACAGGTIGMLSVSALLSASEREGESGIVICSDVARYEAPSTAEITQGAGAVAMLIEHNPRLLTLDIGTQGYASHDVDDFFRPLGSVTARVKGGYSVQCYNESFNEAFEDHCARRGEEPADVLRTTDLFVLHVPFYKMALTALHKLVARHMDIVGEDVDAFMAERGFQESLEASKHVGNIYSGSAYMALMFLLKERHQKLGANIVGKRLLLASYGSGNTMTVVSGRIAPGAPEVISAWDLDRIWENQETQDLSRYERWLSAPFDRETYASLLEKETVPVRSFYLKGIREDGYREYAFAQ